MEWEACLGREYSSHLLPARPREPVVELPVASFMIPHPTPHTHLSSMFVCGRVPLSTWLLVDSNQVQI